MAVVRSSEKYRFSFVRIRICSRYTPQADILPPKHFHLKESRNRDKKIHFAFIYYL